MKKKLLLINLLLAAFCGQLINAQQVLCGSNFQIYMDNPEFAADQAKFKAYLQQYAQADPDAKAHSVRIMPVVVHVIHDGGNSNVSNNQINNMITKLNQAFRKTPPNINTLPLHFDSIAGDALIEFRLATKDPLGNCTDGIRRIYSPQKSNGAYDDKRFKSLSYWDRSKYLNIWIVGNITDPTSTGGGTILGYSLFPGGAAALKDGVALAYGSMGTQGVAAHEVGHHLNLIHTWGDAVCGDDEVEDTPIARDANFAWANPCDTAVNEADCYENIIDNYRDSLLRYGIGENYQNYMDYVNNYNCPNMFTDKQIERINGALNFYVFRKSAVSPENNIMTGTEENGQVCENKIPVAEFWSKQRVICSGSTVQFVDGSFNGEPTSWLWEFEGGTPSSSTDQSPTVTYNSSGTYGVKLTVSNLNGSNSKIKGNVVFVMSPEVESKAWGYSENFEGGGSYEAGRWTVVNDQTDPGKGWGLSAPQVSYSGSFSAKMNNFQNVRDNNSSLISSAVNMDAINGSDKVIRFKVAYAIRTNEDFGMDPVSQEYVPIVDDILTLSRSSNCGSTWTTLKTFSVNEILSAGLSPNVFNPNDLTLWKQISVNLSGASGTGSEVRYRFHFNSGGSLNNNLFIDDIQIVATSGPNASIDEVSPSSIDLNVYPNPVNDQSTISFTLPQNVNKSTIGVYDITGRFIAAVYSGKLDAGKQNFTIDRQYLGASGIYFLQMDLDGKTLSKKIVVQ